MKERRTNLKADELPSETVKQILFGEMLDDPLQGIILYVATHFVGLSLQSGMSICVLASEFS